LKAVTRNIAANFAGRLWTMLIGVVFVPVYLKLLGIERYGLIGFFLTLQGVLGILDLGLSLTLNRELARSGDGSSDGARMARVLRTIEAAYWAVALLAGVLVVILAPWIAGKWINSTLPPGEITSAVRIMGMLIALQMPLALYQGGLSGLQRQVSANLILTIAVTVRNGGAALALWIFGPSIGTYFYCQLAVTAAATAFSARLLWSLIPCSRDRRAMDFSVFSELWRFAAAVSANSVVGIALTQLDKVILINLLSLERFGYYALASLVSGFLWSIILPLNTALYPRFVQLLERGTAAELSIQYHKTCQFLAVILFPTALLLAMFSHELLSLWTGNEAVARNSSLLVSLLSIGTTINGIASVPAYLQSAAGWPGLVLKTNTLLMVVLVPALLIIVPLYGAVGAALVWVAINCIYVLITVPIMHRRLLRGELRSWYTTDVALPALAVLVIGVPARLLMPAGWPAYLQLLFLALVWGVCALSAGLIAPQFRRTVFDILSHRRSAARNGPDITNGNATAPTPKGLP
jgi:O-antigen/teichoic acid export membrane protein